MHWRISQIIAVIIFLASVVQLYREKNIAYLILALGSFASLMTWLKGPVVLAAEKLNDPNMDVVDKSVEALQNIIKKNNSRSARWELRRAMRFHQNPEVSRKAAIALAEIDDVRAIKSLMNHLPHADVVKTFEQLNEIEDKKIRLQLIERYETKRDIPIELVARLGSSDAVSFLCDEMQRIIENSTETLFKDETRVVVRYLGKYKVKSAVDSLVDLFEIAANYGSNNIDYLLEEIISALNDIGAPPLIRIINILINALNISNDYVHIRAESILRKLVPSDEFEMIKKNASYKLRVTIAGSEAQDGT